MIKIEIPELSKPLLTKHINKIPRSNGIYLFYNLLGELLYIGKARNLKKRISDHLNGRTNTRNYYLEFKVIKFFVEESELFTDLYETYMINTMHAKYNVGKLKKENHDDIGAVANTIENEIVEVLLLDEQVSNLITSPIAEVKEEIVKMDSVLEMLDFIEDVLKNTFKVRISNMIHILKMNNLYLYKFTEQYISNQLIKRNIIINNDYLMFSDSKIAV